ncbi:hypothetical protein JOH51_004973 [Rhizobium leguminosarum]|nr:hypothetical protein [Rhizobium leguminosarum]
MARSWHTLSSPQSKGGVKTGGSNPGKGAGRRMGPHGTALNQEVWRVIRCIDGESLAKQAPKFRHPRP